MTTLPFTFVPNTVTDANQVNANFRAVAEPGQFTGPLSVGTPSPANATPGTIVTERFVVTPSVGAGGAVGSRIDINCYSDTTQPNPVLRYLTTGPAWQITWNPADNLVYLYGLPSGTAGAATPPLTRLATFAMVVPDQQTNLSLATQSGATTTFQAVLTGPVGSGPGGVGRALYVAT